MKITFDQQKNQRNIEERGLPFESVQRFDFDNSFVFVDDRKDYGETRYIAIGYLDNRLHVVCFIETDEGIRVISLRKANLREGENYGKPLSID